jgi:hypothetical protein
MNAQALIWTIITITGIADAVLLFTDGITVSSYWQPMAMTIFLYVLSIAFQRISSISLLLISFAQICAFSFVGALLTYAAMAASPFPMADALLSHADHALGFDWLAWFKLVNAHPMLHFVLKQAYASAVIQVCCLMFYFSYADGKRVHEFLLAGMVSIIIIVPLMVLLPAVGAWSQHNAGMVEPWRDDILALRSHTLMTIDRPNGIVSFPSFHTVLGLLFANMARGRKWFTPLLFVNLLLIASVPTEGAHYGVDILSGFAVAFVALGATQYLLACCSGSIIVAVPNRSLGTYGSDVSCLLSNPKPVPIACLKVGEQPYNLRLTPRYEHLAENEGRAS